MWTDFFILFLEKILENWKFLEMHVFRESQETNRMFKIKRQNGYYL